MFVKVLGAIDILSAFALFALALGIHPYFQLVLFFAGVHFLKGIFIFIGDILSWIDVFGGIVLILSLVIALPPLFYWLPGFVILAKGIVSVI